MAGPTRPNQRPERRTESTLILVVRPGSTVADIDAVARAVDVQIDPVHRPLPLPKGKQARASKYPREVPAPDLSLFYRVRAPQERLQELAERLRQFDIVQGAYVKGPAEMPAAGIDCPTLTVAPPAVTPNFEPKQGYLNKAPKGIDAKFAWTKSGGTGTGVRIIDVERAWGFAHEDLLMNPGGVVGGYPPADLHMEKHGTAVIGILIADRNSFGVSGISPDANLRAVSTFDTTGDENTAWAIAQTTAFLAPGDIMLLEMHRLGPPDFETGTRYVPVEWWPDDFAAIQWATSQGVIVVEAAGNGSSNLDDPVYNTPDPGFPAYWKNPFDRAIADSGAIVVGAGAPPVGGWGRDRSRLGFSDFGEMVDAQGWGRAVVTLGYGCFQGGPDMRRWYTAEFGGTSGALPMVAGAIACVQGRLSTLGKPLLTPATARTLLRSTGSPQQNGIGGMPKTERIGNRPDLKAMFKALSITNTPSIRRKK